MDEECKSEWMWMKISPLFADSSAVKMAPSEAPARARAPVQFSFSMVEALHRQPSPFADREYVTSVDTLAGIFTVSNPRSVLVVPKLEDSWPEQDTMAISEDQKLRDDLMNLPEQATWEKYEELPVEEFGEALLRGMGWQKGQPIGRNATVVVAPVELVKRQEKLGLGAVPATLRRSSRAACTTLSST